uniref:Secreted protein n=1 Tax=Macrostomum lignano TaxID=282301 RepID=A0A1I8IZR9_9PLAT
MNSCWLCAPTSTSLTDCRFHPTFWPSCKQLWSSFTKLCRSAEISSRPGRSPSIEPSPVWTSPFLIG